MGLVDADFDFHCAQNNLFYEKVMQLHLYDQVHEYRSPIHNVLIDDTGPHTSCLITSESDNTPTHTITDALMRKKGGGRGLPTI